MGKPSHIAAYARWEEADAEAHAQSIGGYKKYLPNGATQGKNGVTSIGVWAVYNAPAQQAGNSTSGGGGGGGTGGSPPPPAGTSGGPAPPPMMANQPVMTGGGAGFNRGANTEILDLPQTLGDWQGLETLIPDNRLPAAKSPLSIGWDRFGRYGSRCVRRGIAKLTDDILSVRDSGASALNADYRGLSLLSLPSSGSTDDQLMMVFRDDGVAIGTAPGGGNLATSMHFCSAGPEWGRPRALGDMAGPDVTLSNPSTTVIRATSIYGAIPDTNDGLKQQTLKALTIRYAGPFSGGVPRYPVDPDEGTDESTILVLRDSWDGASRADDTPALTAGKYWFTAWVHGLEGMTREAHMTLTV